MNILPSFSIQLTIVHFYFSYHLFACQVKLACETKFFQNSIMVSRLRHFQRIIGEANKRGFGILPTRKISAPALCRKRRFCGSVATLPMLALLLLPRKGREGKGTDITKFEIVWWKAQSLRRIESSNATNSLKLTDRTEGVFEPTKKAYQQHHYSTTSDRGHCPLHPARHFGLL